MAFHHVHPTSTQFENDLKMTHVVQLHVWFVKTTKMNIL